MCIALLCLSFSASAYDFEVDGIYYNINTEIEGEVGVCNAPDNASKYYGSIEIPSKVIYNGKTYSVTQICYGAFSKCYSLKSAIIPNTVKEIGVQAFYNCFTLTSVNIPNSVNILGENAFDGCSSLTSAIIIPNSISRISMSLFYGCSSLTSVTIPNSVTEISDHAFYRCSSLKSLTIPNSVTEISDGAFYGCSSLKSLTIPNSVNLIGMEAFRECSSLESLTIPNSINRIRIGAFLECSSLKSIYNYSMTPVQGDSPGSNPWYGNMTIFDDTVLEEATLYVPVGVLAAYEKIYPWCDFKNIKEMDFSRVIETSIVNNDFKVSVNNGIITINSCEDNVVIYDMQGRMVYNGSDKVISGLPSGIYVVKSGVNRTKISI